MYICDCLQIQVAIHGWKMITVYAWWPIRQQRVDTYAFVKKRFSGYDSFCLLNLIWWPRVQHVSLFCAITNTHTHTHTHTHTQDVILTHTHTHTLTHIYTPTYRLATIRNNICKVLQLQNVMKWFHVWITMVTEDSPWYETVSWLVDKSLNQNATGFNWFPITR